MNYKDLYRLHIIFGYTVVLAFTIALTFMLIFQTYNAVEYIRVTFTRYNEHYLELILMLYGIFFLSERIALKLKRWYDGR